MSRPIVQRRRGATLLEMIMVIAMATTVALVAVRLLDAVLRVQRVAGHRAHAAAELTRLADSLRRDARQTRGVQVEGGNLVLQIGPAARGDGARIHYGISGGHVRRQVAQGDATLARDSFVLIAKDDRDGSRRQLLARQNNPAWQWDPESGVIALELWPAPGPLRGATLLRIEAAVRGSDRSATADEVTP